MTDLPNFDPLAPPAEPVTPKKPRRKPTKRKAPVKAAAAVPKRRVPKKRKAAPAPESYAGGHFTSEVYRLIGALVELNAKTRNLVIEVARGLSK